MKLMNLLLVLVMSFQKLFLRGYAGRADLLDGDRTDQIADIGSFFRRCAGTKVDDSNYPASRG
jgi:hypothetical protein